MESWSSAHRKRQIPSETRSEARKQSGGCKLQPPLKCSKYSRNKQLIFQGCHARLVEWICTARIRLKQGGEKHTFFRENSVRPEKRRAEPAPLESDVSFSAAKAAPQKTYSRSRPPRSRISYQEVQASDSEAPEFFLRWCPLQSAYRPAHVPAGRCGGHGLSLIHI